MNNLNRIVFIIGFIGDETPSNLQRALSKIHEHLRNTWKLYIVVNNCDKETILFLNALALLQEKLEFTNTLTSMNIATSLVQLAKYLEKTRRLQRRDLSIEEYEEYQVVYEKTIHYLNSLLQYIDSEERVLGIIEELAKHGENQLEESIVKNIQRFISDLPIQLDVILASKLLPACSENYMEVVYMVYKALESRDHGKLFVLVPREIARYIGKKLSTNQILEY